MAQQTESLLTKGGDVLRELASHQGAAYREYGEALAKFGSGEIDVGKLVKTAGDLYIREASRISTSVFEAGSQVFDWTLGKIGIQKLEPDAAHKEHKKTK